MYFATSIIIGLAFGSAIFAAIVLILRRKSNCIFGIYPEKGIFYRLKYPLAMQFVKYWRRKIFTEHENELNSAEYLQSLEKPQILASNPKSYDVVSFFGANEKGYKFMITIERRRRGVTRAAFYLWIPNRGLFSSPNLPEMVHFTTDGNSESEEFVAKGFRIYPMECMRRWRVTYIGEVKQGTNRYAFEFDGEFSSELDHFDYNRHLSSSVIADSVAREAWDDSFFHMAWNVDNILKTRIHYEQSGKINGTFQLGEESKIQLCLSAFRDHSFGTDRCLSSIYRYVYFALFLDDGTNLVVGILCQPSFFLSSLKVGYICLPEGGGYEPITSCNFELYSYGERGVPPNHQNFIVETKDRRHFVQIKSCDSSIRYVGGNWESKVYNQFVSCTVNGIDGHGIAEYLYRNKTGRCKTATENDPDWYKEIKSNDRRSSNGELLDDWVGVVW
ncbi:uncharacterized protein LOC129920156 [Episyrphus balteatus]|uniref:uncharacterized protein LOC129920156 n=1 Tax=Episyrphus balteatus TaxID=286459 RepID=UPI0024859DF7|nr:uncharacterized protein LOC129920156 [Episyrphus balteatus]